MKKLISLFSAFVIALTMAISTEAKTVRVSALETFNTANPPQVLHVQMNGNARLDYDLMLFEGFQVAGKVIPQNGGFVFVPINYINYQEENLPVKKQYQAVYKGAQGTIRQNQPFTLVFPDASSEAFQYYVPSVSDMN